MADAVKDAVCFHCQQCAEKYLKALLQELGQPIAKTHDLQRLFVDVLPFEPSLKPLRRGAVSLTQFAVDYSLPRLLHFHRQDECLTAKRWAGSFRGSQDISSATLDSASLPNAFSIQSPHGRWFPARGTRRHILRSTTREPDTVSSAMPFGVPQGRGCSSLTLQARTT